MGKLLVFEYDNMKRAGQLINMVTVSGVNNIRILAELSMILDSGKIVEKEEVEKDGNK